MGITGPTKAFTFHYVSILIVFGGASRSAGLSFTFHYVSILIRTKRYEWLIFSIYIPLCLYFNRPPAK